MHNHIDVVALNFTSLKMLSLESFLSSILKATSSDSIWIRIESIRIHNPDQYRTYSTVDKIV
jgi:hypothetical protein